MRSYEDIANRIMKRGDEIIEQRKLRAAKIKHTSYAVSGMCAAVIAGVGLWKLSSAKDLGNDKFSGSSMIENSTEPTASETVTETKTTSVTAAAVTSGGTTTTTAAVTTQTTSAASASASKISVTTAANTTKAVPQTTALTTLFTEAPTTSASTTSAIVTSPEIITEPPSPTSTFDPNVFREIFVQSFQELAGPAPAGTYYKLSSYDAADRLKGSYIRPAHIEKEYTENGRTVIAAADIDIYSIRGLSGANAMIAAKFHEKIGSYIYVSMDYSPTDLSSLINEMGLSADGLTGEAYTGSQRRKDIDKSSIWALITADTSLPNVYSGAAETDSAVKLIYRKDYVSGSLSVTENGQLICELCGIRSCYDIGRDSAETVISALSQEQ
ncbi:MAG: hypothetical protein IKN66_08525 [Ruminococcus sp.]|nr:hypothetical protein [Ruminococcus sp.]